MDYKHRIILKKYRNELEELINLNDIKRSLIDSKIFTNRMLDDIWNGEALLFEELPTRGPAAFSKFIEVLCDNGFASKADEMLFAGVTDYNISLNQPGYCIIINNELCCETDLLKYAHDMEAKELDLALKTIGYPHPYFKTNLCSNDIISILTEFSQKDFSEADSCIVIILSNGAKAVSNVIFDNNGECILLNEILNLFCDSKCPSLKDKPKIFFLPSFDGTYDFSNGVNSPRNIELLSDVNDIFIWNFPSVETYLFSKQSNCQFFGEVLSEHLKGDFLEHDFEKIVHSAYDEFLGRFSNETDLKSVPVCTKLGLVREKIIFSTPKKLSTH
ncbi:CASPASE_P20 domain-containing protein [Trichonephila clavata]|uniref:CASPASE_P20 domain-containing protein n=1 Tax=Trichonephila clavata TaxID=2740835 RepID=A0A8X6JAB2_TRICU|nr:CASPASE_P20 domain-containing protein [Trichonephila clavata]